MTSSGRSRVVSVALMGAAFGACASGGKPADTTSTRPRLTALAPDTVSLIPGNVTEVDLRGSGFDSNRIAPQNTVRIGALVLRAVPSTANGTRIRVAIPDAVPSGGEAPPAPWSTGRYPVSVSTPGGTSDTILLSIRAGGRLP